MKIIDVLKFNRELIKRLKLAGIRIKVMGVNVID